MHGSVSRSLSEKSSINVYSVKCCADLAARNIYTYIKYYTMTDSDIYIYSHLHMLYIQSNLQ